MLINLTDVFTSEGKVKKVSLPYENESFSYGGSVYSIAKQSEIDLTFTNIGTGSLLVEGVFSLTLMMPCDRCLQNVEVPLTVEFSHKVISPEKEKDTVEEEEQSFMSGYELDVDVLINNEILINMPVKVLCGDDCKGICPVCGKNRNEGDCGCDTFVPDPRMAAIKDIFNANKEV